MNEKISLPKVKAKAKIGILGGTFDPPHLCHQLLALSFIALEPIEELWIIPCADHAFKKETSRFHHRLNMCFLAFERLKQTRVLDLENKLKTPSFTIQTIETIKSIRPDIDISFALGSDLLGGMGKWHRLNELLQQVKLVIFERESYPINRLSGPLRNAKIHNHFILPNINSSKLRKILSEIRLKNNDGFLDKEVKKYIINYNLY